MTNALPPGPSESPFVQAAQFGQAPYAFLERLGRRFGPIFTIRLPGDPPRIALSEPALIRQVFALKPEQISAARAGFPVNFGERSLLLLDGEAHRRDRALIMPPLHGERLPGYARTMRDATVRALDALRPGEEVDLLPLLQGVTLEVMGEGDSMGPLNPGMKRLAVQRLGDIKYPINWTSLDEYLRVLEAKGVSVNVASFIGSATARIHVLGEGDVRS